MTETLNSRLITDFNPPIMQTIDESVARDIYAGVFAFAARTVQADETSIFLTSPPSPEWQRALQGFDWLPHLAYARQSVIPLKAISLLQEWINVAAGKGAQARQPHVGARRVWNWLLCLPVIRARASPAVADKIHRALNQQVHDLSRMTFEGAHPVELSIGLCRVLHALAFTAREAALPRALAELEATLDTQVQSDGCLISRNPAALVRVLGQLLVLRAVLAQGAADTDRSAGLDRAVERMSGALRVLSLVPRRPALFHGAGEVDQGYVTALLAGTSDPDEAPHIAHARCGGYHVLSRGDSRVIMDTGAICPVPFSATSHASCLGFELAWKACPVIVNCGSPRVSDEALRQLLRATAAHSTLVINDVSSCRFSPQDIGNGQAQRYVVAGPRQVNCKQEDEDKDKDEGVCIRARHDGYMSAFNLLHERRLALSRDGGALKGRDRLTPGRDTDLHTHLPYVLRFHLHPDIDITQMDRRHMAMSLPNGDAVSFTCHDEDIAIEESLYTRRSGVPVPTQQIVIASDVQRARQISWSLEFSQKRGFD